MEDETVLGSKAVRILSLNGGGVRGLFTISVLAEIEQLVENTTVQKDVKIGNYFDLITGTSIGGILALGLAEGKSARELKDVFYEQGHKIFPRKEYFDGFFKKCKKLIGPTYKTEPLRETIVEMIGDSITFKVRNLNVAELALIYLKKPISPSLFS